MGDAALAAALKRDRWIVFASLLLVAFLAWAYVLWLSSAMKVSDMPGMNVPAGMTMAPGFVAWTFAHALFVFAMWAVMMVGMMTPSAAPMVLLYAQVARHARASGHVFAAAGWFAAGYLVAWTAFAALATAAQYGLERAALLSPMMVGTSRTFGAVILVAAGLYQLTPVKHACLAQCRSPLSFVQRHGGFRPEIWHSVRLGFRHGLYCVGCCWAVMALLFVGGVMNVLWIAAIAVFVLGERVLPGGAWLARLAGGASVAMGIWMLFAPATG